MRDGVHLAADLYRPARGLEPVPGRHPALLERTPYAKDQAERVELNGLWYAQRGYVVVIQDVRGRYHSEGEFTFLRQEPADGYDTVEWIAAQPWSDGRVGTLGTSYMGWTQSALATQAPPHLRAMWVNQGGANAYTSTVRHNGAFELRFLCWALWQGAKSREAKADPVLEQALGAVNVRDWLTRTPLKPGASPLSLIPRYERWAFDLIQRGDYDPAFWGDPGLNIAAYFPAHADVPMVFSSGWYDSYTRATLESFVGLGRLKRGPVKCLMGPWTHGHRTLALTYAGDADFGADAAVEYNELRLRFFDAVLRGTPTGWTDDPPLRLFIMGGGSGRRTSRGRLDHGGRWRDEREWPLARTRMTPFYFQPGGGLAPTLPPAGAAPSRYQFDPRRPVPTIGGNMSSLVGLLPRPTGAPEVPVEERERDWIGIPGAFDQREAPQFLGCVPPYLPLASRPDVLVFQSEPLPADLEVTGPITVVLHVGSDRPDTDVTAKLIDVYPPSLDYPEGYALNLTDSILRLRYREGDGQARPLEPGQAYRVEFPLYPTANRFAAGHRIRLDISSSNFPRFDVNPNTGDPLWTNTTTLVATNTLFHDADRPSHVVLPIIPS
jgi:putative CocE/NonD family hydrolase